MFFFCRCLRLCRLLTRLRCFRIILFCFLFIISRRSVFLLRRSVSLSRGSRFLFGGRLLCHSLFLALKLISMLLRRRSARRGGTDIVLCRLSIFLYRRSCLFGLLFLPLSAVIFFPREWLVIIANCHKRFRATLCFCWRWSGSLDFKFFSEKRLYSFNICL